MMGESNGNGDGAKWRTLTTVIFITGAAAAIFAGGMSYGTVQSKLDAKDADTTYVRKDGRELEEIRGRLQSLNDKMDYIIRQSQGQSR
ncbi:MAG TPA: hypothetical protein VF456_13320 [Vicinamibacterales bacterium]